MSKYVLLKNDGGIEVMEQERPLKLETMYHWIAGGCRCIDIATSVISAKMGCEVLLQACFLVILLRLMIAYAVML